MGMTDEIDAQGGDPIERVVPNLESQKIHEGSHLFKQIY